MSHRRGRSKSTLGDKMNKDNVISKQTKLFGLIGEKAGTNRLFVMINNLIKENKVDAMIIPMNIREDDFYFTVANMKKSQVDGAYIDAEFQKSVLDLLDFRDEMVEVYAKCDFVVRENGNLKGYLLEKNDVKTQEELANIVFDKFIKG
jgi:shikimate 5-dehydrogenase